MSWFVYILRCSDNSLYCGTTTDLDRRLEAHNCGDRGSVHPVKIARAAGVACTSNEQIRSIQRRIQD